MKSTLQPVKPLKTLAVRRFKQWVFLSSIVKSLKKMVAQLILQDLEDLCVLLVRLVTESHSPIWCLCLLRDCSWLHFM